MRPHAAGMTSSQAAVLRGCSCMKRFIRSASRPSIAPSVRALHSRHTQLPDAVDEWPGLQVWRDRGINPLRTWGAANKPSAAAEEPGAAAAHAVPLPDSLVGVALLVLNTADPGIKAAVTHRGWKAYCQGLIPLHYPQQQQQRQPQQLPGQQQQQQQPPERPARPSRPQLVIPKLVPSPKASPLPLNAHMLHNLAHIELNAVDLAWDTVARYAHLRLPPAFYEDFARVADDESRHLSWCVQRLAELNHCYGDMVAHDLLWEGAQASSDDLAARLAVVPLSQEARGLDAGQRLVDRLVGAGDSRSAAIVALIAEEEKAHVAVGVVWFMRLCAALGVDAPSCFRAWLTALAPDLLKGPFNHAARQEVGLQRAWYDVAQWPPELLSQMVQPAVAAAARGQGQTVPAAAAAGQQQPHVAARMAVVGSTLLQQAQGGALATQDSGSSSSDTCGSGSAQAHELQPVTVPWEGPALEELRQRLWRMLQVEAAVCSSGGSSSSM